jgi:hypothetical protein
MATAPKPVSATPEEVVTEPVTSIPLTKIGIQNIHNTAIGIGNNQMIGPNEIAGIEVTEDEYNMWKQCNYVKILAPYTESFGGTVQDEVSLGINEI